MSHVNTSTATMAETTSGSQGQVHPSKDGRQDAYAIFASSQEPPQHGEQYASSENTDGVHQQLPYS